MDTKGLNNAIQEIAFKRNELKKTEYSNPNYDVLEEELHDLEDALLDHYGNYLEGVLKEVHSRLSPETDVLFPTAYLAKAYLVGKNNEFSVATTEGVFVDVESIPGKETKLVIVPNPLRIILNVGKENQEIVWSHRLGET